MSQPDVTRVRSSSGLRGTVIATPQRTSDGDEQMIVEFEDGRRVVVARSSLVAEADGSYYLPVDLDLLGAAAATRTVEDGETIVLPVLEEVVTVGKRAVERGRMVVSKRVQVRQETVDVPLLHEQIEVERVPINEVVGEAVPVRYEGDTMIVPVLEEVLVVEKRLMLREELRITKRQTTVNQPQQVTLRREEVVVERVEPEAQTSTTTTERTVRA